MKTLHLFAGAGGGIIADMILGHTPVGAVEIDPFCREVLRARQRDGWLPEFEIFGDIKKFNGKPFRGKVDCISGGFPCQDISAAGKGEGIFGERSGLFFELSRVVSEVRPRLVFLENSPCIISRGLDAVLGELEALGYDSRWCILSASDVGALHRRERWWGLFSDANGEHGKKLRFGKSEEEKHAGFNELCSKVPNPENKRILRRNGEFTENKGPENPGRGKTVNGLGGGGILNPDWVEWLMGWPPGWTDPGKPLNFGPLMNGESRGSWRNAPTGARD